MNDIFDAILCDLKNGDYQTFIQEIEINAGLLTENQIKLLFDLSDDEIIKNDIQKAIQHGEAKAALFAARKIREAAEKGEKWAILKLYEMNKGKEKQTTNRIVGYQNMNNETDWEKLKEMSEFN